MVNKKANVKNYKCILVLSTLKTITKITACIEIFLTEMQYV